MNLWSVVSKIVLGTLYGIKIHSPEDKVSVPSAYVHAWDVWFWLLCAHEWSLSGSWVARLASSATRLYLARFLLILFLYVSLEILRPPQFWSLMKLSVKYIPSWFPFADFKQQAKIWAKVAHAAQEESFSATMQDVVCDVTSPHSLHSDGCLSRRKEFTTPPLPPIF